MSTSALKTAAIVLGLIYFIWPIDLIPDRFGILGRLDDVLLIAFMIWKTYQSRHTNSTQQKASSTHQASRPQQAPASPAKSPAEILEVSPDATREEIETRYRELMKQYHPDRVTHLGKEFQELAHEKAVEIQGAYQALIGNH